MKNPLTLLMLLFTLALTARAADQKDPVKNAVVNLYSQLLVYPQEKVYVQTDRPYYLTGEKIHFRAFLLHASKLTPATFSRYVYVELVSPVDTVVLRSQIRISEDKLFYGTLTLPESLPEGEYRLRSYTRYMENTGERFFYTRPVIIADPKATKIDTETKFDFSREGQVGVKLRFKDAKTSAVRLPAELRLRSGNSSKGKTAKPDSEGRASETFDLKGNDSLRVLLVEYKDGGNSFKKYLRIPYETARPEINFYPEGGQLVAGAMNRVAFKALLPGGQAAGVKGAVYNSRDELQAKFSTVHEGMGSFLFKPTEGETYHARCEYDGNSFEIKLPEIKANALSLQTAWEGDSLSVSVLHPEGLHPDTCYLLIHRQGVPTYLQPWDFSGKTCKWGKTHFSTGVSHLMLLAKDFQPISERLVFNNRHDDPEVEISTNATSYRQREKVSLDIRLPGAAADTLPASFAIAVTDDKDVKIDTTTNIVAEILLSSELEGHVSNPARYFGEEEGVAEAADLLMLTHGWRRYHVAEALQGRLQKPAVKPEITQSLTGVLKKPTGKPYPKGKVQLTAVGYTYAEATESDEQGCFEFTDFEFPDSTAYQLLSQTNEKTNEIEIWPDAIQYPRVTIPWSCSEKAVAQERRDESFTEYVFKANRKYVMENGMRQVDLPQVTVKASTKKKLKRFDNGVVAAIPERCISPDELKEFPPVSFEDLFYRIRGVQNVSENGVKFVPPDPARILLDGIERDYKTLVQMYDARDIGQVDVYVYNLAVSPGPLIVLTTWPSGTWGKQDESKDYLKMVLPLGYQQPLEFYSPRYDTPETQNDKKADLRSTIYWKPNVQTYKDNKTPVDFYTADSPTTYSVTVEGIAPGRKLVYCRKKAIIKVTEPEPNKEKK